MNNDINCNAVINNFLTQFHSLFTYDVLNFCCNILTNVTYIRTNMIHCCGKGCCFLWDSCCTFRFDVNQFLWLIISFNSQDK